MRDPCDVGGRAMTFVEGPGPALDIEKIVGNQVVGSGLGNCIPGGNKPQQQVQQHQQQQQQRYVDRGQLLAGADSMAAAAATVGDDRAEKDTKIDLDAAYRAVNMALAGLDLGGKRHQHASAVPPGKIDQKRPIQAVQQQQQQQGSSPRRNPPAGIGQKLFSKTIRRSRGPSWLDGGQLYSLPEAIAPSGGPDRMQIHPMQAHQAQQQQPQGLFRAPSVDNRFGSGINGLKGGGEIDFGGARGLRFATDRDAGSPMCPRQGPPSSGPVISAGGGGGGRGGFRHGVSSSVDLSQYFAPVFAPQRDTATANKSVNRLESASSGPADFRAGSGSATSPPVLKPDAGRGPYSLAANLDAPPASNMRDNVRRDAITRLPETLDSLDEAEVSVDFDSHPTPRRGSSDPRTRSEQALLLAITGVLKCAVEGNLARHDVLSDLNFLIVTVRRHLSEYQRLSQEAAETLANICSTLPTACKCAGFEEDVVDSLRRFMNVISSGHPTLRAHGSCLNNLSASMKADSRQHSEVQHQLRKIHRKLTGGTTSNGVQHVALALFDVVGEKGSPQTSYSGADFESNRGSGRSLALSLLASRSTAASSHRWSDGEVCSTGSDTNFLGQEEEEPILDGCVTNNAHLLHTTDRSQVVSATGIWR